MLKSISLIAFILLSIGFIAFTSIEQVDARYEEDGVLISLSDTITLVDTVTVQAQTPEIEKIEIEEIKIEFEEILRVIPVVIVESITEPKSMYLSDLSKTQLLELILSRIGYLETNQFMFIESINDINERLATLENKLIDKDLGS